MSVFSHRCVPFKMFAVSAIFVQTRCNFFGGRSNLSIFSSIRSRLFRSGWAVIFHRTICKTSKTLPIYNVIYVIIGTNLSISTTFGNRDSRIDSRKRGAKHFAKHHQIRSKKSKKKCLLLLHLCGLDYDDFRTSGNFVNDSNQRRR